MKKIIFISLIIFIKLQLFSVSIELYDGNIINGNIDSISKKKFYLENDQGKKLFVIEKRFINLIDNDSLKTQKLLESKMGEFPNYNSYIEIETIRLNFQNFYKFDKLNTKQSYLLGQFEAKTKHSTLGWSIGGFGLGLITLIPGPLILAIEAYNSHPESKTIPLNVEKDAFLEGYSKKARMKNINSTLIFGIVGTVVTISYFFYMLSQIHITF